MRRCLIALLALVTLSVSTARPVRADGPVAYDTFVKGAVAERGLFTVWHKDGKVYIELQAAQLDKDFIQTIVPASGLGGQFVVWGNTDHLPTELVRFERAGDNVAILWPAPYFVAPHVPAAARAIDRSFARSIVGLAAVAATDDKTGAVVIDAGPFLDDQLDLKAVLAQNLHDQPKAEPYSLDRDRSYFGKVKVFPKNVVIEALQDWTSPDQRLADAVPDPRHVQMRVVYNIAEAPASDDYRPRYADDRVGVYNDVYLSFDNDNVLSRKLRYVVRWNMQPSDPTRPVSPAKHPMVFYLSNTIPEEHRAGIRAAVLKWNDAFLKIGISDALQVRDQPDDPNWDPDDIRYNVLRWVTEYAPSFGADSQTLYDPRTGEEFRTGILISADVPLEAKSDWTHFIDPVRFGRSTDPMPQQFMNDTWLSTIMHETGHNLGMQHNFIGSRAYTAQQLQDKNFTAKYGIASTVMEYAPTNLWPAKYPQGTYVQTVLGPYDYYVMHWAYAPVPGAKTPEDELPTLRKWAAAWSDPRYRYASDEDVSWRNGHAADPRVEQGILTNDPLGWCEVQLDMDRGIMAKLNALFPAPGEAFEAESRAFRNAFGHYGDCATMPAHYIGGQYLSRAHLGDPGAETPVVPVPRAEQHRAFDLMERSLFAANALPVSPELLGRLTYSEWAGYGYVEFEGYGNLPKWAYDPPERHDVPFAEELASLQNDAIRQMFLPSVLARLADGPAETSDRNAMQLSDLFAWMHGAVFKEFNAARPGSIARSRRTLQQSYAGTLIALYATPSVGAPDDARALAHASLVRLEADATRALRARTLDAVTRAHLDLLRARVRDAL
ncbi:MAG: zinc-dependent metalloprotease, partial [Candidatus Eremiobacteraeota bacterium]|nr:zinc-dependent metalloprotease [Candidatus Eremiobacteraeota bacterium]